MVILGVADSKRSTILFPDRSAFRVQSSELNATVTDWTVAKHQVAAVGNLERGFGLKRIRIANAFCQVLKLFAILWNTFVIGHAKFQRIKPKESHHAENDGGAGRKRPKPGPSPRWRKLDGKFVHNAIASLRPKESMQAVGAW